MTPTMLAALQSLHVPAEAVPDALVDWSGELEGQVGPGGPWVPVPVLRGDLSYILHKLALRLSLARPEVRQRIASVMGVGVRCRNCWDGDGRVNPVDCPCFPNQGYLRPPAPARHLLPASELGDLPDALAGGSAGLLACHVARVLAGLGGVCGILPKWEHSHGSTWYRSANSREWATRLDAKGWSFAADFDRHIEGPETGPEGMAAADRAALAHGFALQTADGMLLPWPNPTQPETP